MPVVYHRLKVVDRLKVMVSMSPSTTYQLMPNLATYTFPNPPFFVCLKQSADYLVKIHVAFSGSN